jgi:hypothetical protein
MAVVVALVLGSAVRWAFRHSGGTTYDESLYYAVAWEDHYRLTERDIKTLLAGFIYSDHNRPPGYRLLALPIVVTRGGDIVALRLVSIAWFALTLVMTYFPARRLGGSRAAGALAVILVCLCPQVLAAVIRFGTECPLYLATAATIWFLVREWDSPKPRASGWIALGVALGVGALSKATFAMIGGPVLLLTVLATWLRLTRGPRIAFLVKAGVIGLVIALPWWAKNWRFAMGFAEYSMNFERHSLGESSPAVWGRYLRAFFSQGMGPLAAAVMAAGVVGAGLEPLVRKVRPDHPTERLTQRARWAAIWVLVLAPVPIVITQMLGVNHGVRLVTPAFYFLAIAGAAGAAACGWLRRPIVSVLLALPLIVQAVVLAAPPLTRAAPVVSVSDAVLGPRHLFRDVEYWDYEPLVAMARDRGLGAPSIALLGNSLAYNRAALMHAWARRGERVNVERLWRWEQRDFSLDKVVAAARAYDIVLTAPGLVGDPAERQELDNQYNEAFAQRLRDDPAFGPPQHLRMGRAEPVDLLVFFNRQEARPTTTRPAAAD